MDIEGEEKDVLDNFDMQYACKYIKQIMFETHKNFRFGDFGETGGMFLFVLQAYAVFYGRFVKSTDRSAYRIPESDRFQAKSSPLSQ